MGSSMSAIYDRLEEEKWEENEKWLEKLAEKIRTLNPTSSDFRDLKWIVDNQDKILGNRAIINLLR